MRSGTPRDRVEYRLQVQRAITAPAAPRPTFDPSLSLRLEGSTGRRSNGRASIKSQPRIQLSGRGQPGWSNIALDATPQAPSLTMEPLELCNLLETKMPVSPDVSKVTFKDAGARVRGVLGRPRP